MKNLTTGLLLIAVSFGIIAFKGNIKNDSQSLVVDSKKMDANTIGTWFSNNGNFNRNPITADAGFEWPRNSGKTARYSSGPWIGAKVGNDTLVAIAEYTYEYLPGYTDNNGNPQGSSDPNYRIYKLILFENNPDRQQWPNALIPGNSDQGAPVYYDQQSQTYKALDYGHQTMFYRYTDSYPGVHIAIAGSTLPLKADIKQINYSFNLSDAPGNTIFTQFTLINRRNTSWNDTYFTIWTDDDLGSGSDDLVGCDTLNNMGFTYNGTNSDPVYGAAPPAVSFILLKGPSVYTGINSDTSFFCNGQVKMIKIGYKSLGMSVFNWYANGQDPLNFRESYRLMSGYYKFGEPIIHPITCQQTKFMYSGDPVTGTGWIQTTPDDQRFMMSTGPFTMNPGDTQVIVVAQIIARGSSNLNSISILRQYRSAIVALYNNCFASIPVGINLNNNNASSYNLLQNYPNPFNPITRIRFNIPPSENGELVSLTIYDVLARQVASLINGRLKPGSYEAEWDGSNYPSGVYFYKLTAGSFTETRKMVLVK